MGRPKNEVDSLVIRVTLTLTPGIDDDLIAFFDNLETGKRAAGVMAALRQGSLNAGVEYTGIDEEVLLDSWDSFLE